MLWKNVSCLDPPLRQILIAPLTHTHTHKLIRYTHTHTHSLMSALTYTREYTHFAITRTRHFAPQSPYKNITRSDHVRTSPAAYARFGMELFKRIYISIRYRIVCAAESRVEWGEGKRGVRLARSEPNGMNYCRVPVAWPRRTTLRDDAFGNVRPRRRDGRSDKRSSVCARVLVR